MNLNPEIWGPHAWFFLDSIIIGMPEKPNQNEIAIYKNFFESLQFLLPCKKCRLHYAGNLENEPLTDEILSSKNTTLKWFFNLHNKVRQSNGQSERTYEEILNYYSELYNNKSTKSNNKMYYIIIIVSLIILYLITCSKMF